MAASSAKAVRKIIHHHNLLTHIKKNNQVLIITADNLQANSVKAIRQGLNGLSSSTIVMGKNTTLQRSIAAHAPETEKNAFLGLIPHIKGKVGLVFTDGDPDYVSENIASEYKLQPLLCSSMDIGLCSYWQWVLLTHFDLVNKRLNNVC